MTSFNKIGSPLTRQSVNNAGVEVIRTGELWESFSLDNVPSTVILDGETFNNADHPNLVALALDFIVDNADGTSTIRFDGHFVRPETDSDEIGDFQEDTTAVNGLTGLVRNTASNSQPTEVDRGNGRNVRFNTATRNVELSGDGETAPNHIGIYVGVYGDDTSIVVVDTETLVITNPDDENATTFLRNNGDGTATWTEFVRISKVKCYEVERQILRSNLQIENFGVAALPSGEVIGEFRIPFPMTLDVTHSYFGDITGTGGLSISSTPFTGVTANDIAAQGDIYVTPVAERVNATTSTRTLSVDFPTSGIYHIGIFAGGGSRLFNRKVVLESPRFSIFRTEDGAQYAFRDDNNTELDISGGFTNIPGFVPCRKVGKSFVTTSADETLWQPGRTTEPLVNQGGTEIYLETSFCPEDTGEFLLDQYVLWSHNATNDNFRLDTEIVNLTDDETQRFRTKNIESKDSFGTGITANVISGGNIVANVDTGADNRTISRPVRLVSLEAGKEYLFRILFSSQSANDEATIYEATQSLEKVKL